MHLPCSPTPVGPTPPGPGGDADAALTTSTAKAPARKLSRLNHTAFALAVYASPGFLCPTQDSLRLPARLYRTGFEPAGSNGKVSECILHLIPLSQARSALQTFVARGSHYST